jgi:hypothetical protein
MTKRELIIAKAVMRMIIIHVKNNSYPNRKISLDKGPFQIQQLIEQMDIKGEINPVALLMKSTS